MIALNTKATLDVVRDHQQHFLDRKLARSPLLQFFTGAYRLDISRFFEHITPNTPAKNNEAGISTPSALLENLLGNRLDATIHNIPPALIKKLKNILTAATDNQHSKGQHTLHLGYPCIVVPDETGKTPKLAPVFLFKVEMSIVGQKLTIKRLLEATDITDKSERKYPADAVFNRLLAAYVKRQHGMEIGQDCHQVSIDSANIKDKIHAIFESWKGLAYEFNYPEVSKVPERKSLKHLNDTDNDPYIVDCALLGIAEFSGQETLDDLDKIIKMMEDGQSCPAALNSLIGVRNDTSNAGVEPSKDVEKWLVEKSDPSQEKVIWAHQKNILTVLQGPPGTGKSQTIVNLIADAVAHKKTVLVVCQKRAAIEVVLKRLAANGLGELAVLIDDLDKDRQPVIKRIKEIDGEMFSFMTPAQRDNNSKELQAIEAKIETVLAALNDNQQGRRIKHADIKARLGKLPKPTEVATLKQSIKKALSDNESLKAFIAQTEEWDAVARTTIYGKNLWSKTDTSLAKIPAELERIKNIAKVAAELSQQFLTLAIPLQFDSATRWTAAHHWLTTGGDSGLGIDGFLSDPHHNAGVETSHKQYAQFMQLMQHISQIAAVNPIVKLADLVDEFSNGNFDKARSFRRLADDAGYLREILNLRTNIEKCEILSIADGVLCDKRGNWAPEIDALALDNWLADLYSNHAEAFTQIANIQTFTNNLSDLLATKRKLDSEDICGQFQTRVSARNSLENDNHLRLRKGGNVPKTSLRVLYSKGFSNLKDIAPVLLVSPETASAILPLIPELFDIAVIDEASQMFVAEAIPILFRAKQVLIAGDTKQMPPADFFAFSDNEYDDEAPEDESTDEVELQYIAADRVYSLLEAAEGALPAGGHSRLTLEVHYRSARRELIDFSNHAFYEGKMIIPSGNAKLPPFMQTAIAFEQLHGQFKSGVNRVEGARIVALLKEIFVLPAETRPTIGVIVANTRQRDDVQALLQDTCDADAKFSQELDRERGRTEKGEDVAFFVRSVEHVQGDERDLIIFALTYSGDSRAFGPLNKKDDGRKRLNVAVTRAKLGMIVLNSLNVNHISNLTEKDSSERYYVWQYLRYARAVAQKDADTINDVLNQLNPAKRQLQKNNAATESPFEDEVKAFIESQGYFVECQVGESGFRIDLGVKVTQASNVYLCGVECDGASYHTGWKARTRDVWRQEILESKGWHIQRIWSTEWFDRTEETKASLKNRLKVLFEKSNETKVVD